MRPELPELKPYSERKPKVRKDRVKRIKKP